MEDERNERCARDLAAMLESVRLDGKIVVEKVDQVAVLLQEKLRVDLGGLDGYRSMAESMMQMKLDDDKKQEIHSPRKYPSKGVEHSLEGPTWSQDSSSPEPRDPQDPPLSPNVSTRQTLGAVPRSPPRRTARSPLRSTMRSPLRSTPRSPVPNLGIGDGRGRSPARSQGIPSIPRPNRSRTPIGRGSFRVRSPTRDGTPIRSRSPAPRSRSKSPFRASGGVLNRHRDFPGETSPSVYHDARMHEDSILGASPVPNQSNDTPQSSRKRPPLATMKVDTNSSSHSSATMPSASPLGAQGVSTTPSGEDDDGMNVPIFGKNIGVDEVQFNIGISKPPCGSPYNTRRSPSYKRQSSLKKKTPRANQPNTPSEESSLGSIDSNLFSFNNSGTTPARSTQRDSTSNVHQQTKSPFRHFPRTQTPKDDSHSNNVEGNNGSEPFVSPIPPFQAPEEVFAESACMGRRHPGPGYTHGNRNRRQTAPATMSDAAATATASVPKTPFDPTHVCNPENTAETAVKKKGRSTATPYVEDPTIQFHVGSNQGKKSTKEKTKRGLGFRRGLRSMRADAYVAIPPSESPNAATDESASKTPSSDGSQDDPMNIDGHTPEPSKKAQNVAKEENIQFNIGTGDNKSPSRWSRPKRREKGQRSTKNQNRSRSSFFPSSDPSSQDEDLHQPLSSESIDLRGNNVGQNPQYSRSKSVNDASISNGIRLSMSRKMVLSLREEGKSHYVAKNYCSSIVTYTNAIKQFMANCMDEGSTDLLAVLLSNRAAGLLMIGASTAAVDDCRQALKFASDPIGGLNSAEGGPTLKPKLLNRMARAFIKLGDTDSADLAFEEAINCANTALLSIHLNQGSVESIIAQKGLEQIVQDATLGQAEVASLREAIEHLLSCTQSSLETPQVSTREKNLEALGYVNTALLSAPGCHNLHGHKVALLSSLKRWRETASHCERLATGYVIFDKCFTEDLRSKHPFLGVPIARYLNKDFFADSREDDIRGADLKLNSKAAAEAVLRMPISLIQYYARSLRLEERYPAAESVIRVLEQYVRERSGVYDQDGLRTAFAWLSRESDRLNRTRIERERGDELFRRGDFAAASAKYAFCLTIDSEGRPDQADGTSAGGRLHAVLHCNRAACLMAEKRYQEAMTECTAALRIHPLYMKALLRRARCYSRLERLEEAISEFKRWIEMVNQAKTNPQSIPVSMSPCLFDGPHEATEEDVAQVRMELDEVTKAKTKAEAAAKAETRYRQQRERWQNEKFNKEQAGDAQSRRDYFYSQQSSSSRRWDSFANRGPTRSAKNNSKNSPKQEKQKSPGSMASEKCHYKALEIAKDATGADIKKAYRKLALKFHPDKNKDPKAVEAFRRVKQAYEVLNDASARKKYDSENRWRMRF